LVDSSRRRFLGLAAAVAAMPSPVRSQQASETSQQPIWPSRPVRIVVGFAAGGGVDITARLIGQWLSGRLGASVVIENRPGADGNIGTEVVVTAPPDGYTLLLAAQPNAVNATLYPRLGFNFMRDIAPVAGIVRMPMVVLVHPRVPATTIPALIAHARANPGRINMASAGTGSAPHMAGELFNAMAGVHMVHVPYRGQGPALSDLIGGQVDVMFATAAGTADYIRTGKLRALAVTTTSQADTLRELPTVGDFVPGYRAEQWYGLAAPRGTPAAIVARLNAETNAAFADATMTARFADIGGEPLPGTPGDFARLVADETAKWAKVIGAGGIRAD